MFEIISTTNKSLFSYKDAIVVKGNFEKNGMSGDLESVHGDCYRLNEQGQQAQMIGFFNGKPNPQTGVLEYDLSAMSRADSNLVWDAIDDIQSQIIPVDE